MEITRRLLNLVLARCYQMTDHALESLDEHGFTLNDILSRLATGRVRRSWPRQGKYEVDG